MSSAGMVRRWALLFLLCAMLLGAFAPVFAVETDDALDALPDTSHANAIYLYNITSSSVLYTKHEDVLIDPGPTVKLMTALVVLENLGNDLDKSIIVEERMVADVYGSNINLQVGEVVTIEQLLNALVIGNSNDAAAVLANIVAGSIDAFVVMMNEKASALGASSTVYTNPTGLHDDSMVTTAADTAKIALYLYKFSVYREIAKQPSYVMDATNKSKERTIYSRNYFISTATEYKYYTPSINGLNAGGTNDAGFCVVASSIYANIEYLCIVMGADQEYITELDENGEEVIKERNIYSFVVAQEMLWWAYFNFSYVRVLDTSTIICEVPVSLSDECEYIALMPENAIDLFLPNGADVSKDINYSWILHTDTLTAPVQAGQVVGMITLIYNDSIAGRVNLVAKSNVSRSEWRYVLSLVKTFVSSTIFRTTAIALVVIAVLYVLINSVVRYERAQAQQKKGRNSRL